MIEEYFNTLFTSFWILIITGVILISLSLVLFASAVSVPKK